MSQITRSASRMRENISSRTFPASMISPVVDPASPASASAGPIRVACTLSKSNSLPAESFFFPKGRMTNARAMGSPLPADCGATGAATSTEFCAYTVGRPASAGGGLDDRLQHPALLGEAAVARLDVHVRPRVLLEPDGQ